MQIELPKELVVASRGRDVTLDLSKLPEAVVIHAALHGLKQRIADGAASAATIAAKNALGDEAEADKLKAWRDDNPKEIADFGVELMQKIVDTLEGGEWGIERGTGATADPLMKHLRTVARDAMKQPGNEKILAKYKATKDKAPFVDELIAKHRDAFTPHAEKRLEAEREQKKALGALTIE